MFKGHEHPLFGVDSVTEFTLGVKVVTYKSALDGTIFYRAKTKQSFRRLSLTDGFFFRVFVTPY